MATAKTSAAPFVPAGADLPELSRASSRCQGCELYVDATPPIGGGTQPRRRPWCRFSPTCSHYAVQALQLPGLGRGSWLAARRLLRCRPGTAGGLDSVPQR